MAQAQSTDSQIRALQSSPSSSLVVEAIPLPDSPCPLYCDTCTGLQRPLVPREWRRTVFHSLHGLSHSGIRATQKLITSRFVWPGINADVRRWTRSCVQCQRAKAQRHFRSPPSSFLVPDARFDIVHIDLVGPLPSSRGFTYLLTCVDRFTRWPEVIPLTTSTTDVVARAFLSGWISRFGVPSTIVTDRGRQFESHLWSNLMTLLSSKRARTTAYHPQANGLVERFHRQLKASLKAYHNPTAWMDVLPLVLLGVRTALKADISSTAAEMVYGTTLRLPGEFFTTARPTPVADPTDYISQFKAHMQVIRPTPPRPTSALPHSPLSDDFATTTHVFIRHDAVRKPLQAPYDGPYPIVDRTDKHFTVGRNGHKDTVSIDRLKPAHLDCDTVTSPSEFPDPPSTSECRHTRSGRRVHFPRRLSSYVSSNTGGGVV